MNKNEKKKIKAYLSIIDEIEIVRKKNNVNWMDILRLAFTKAPNESKKLIMRVNMMDQEISSLLNKLSKIK